MRGALLLSTLVLGLSACASEGDDKEGAPSPIPGYELAAAQKARASVQPVIDVSVDQLVAAQRGTIRLIDIRRDDEVAGGMIPGAEHIPMEAFDPAAVTAGDDREIILYCRSGRRSRIVGEKLAAHTGKPAQHLDGGIIAWGEAGKKTIVPE